LDKVGYFVGFPAAEAAPGRVQILLLGSVHDPDDDFIADPQIRRQPLKGRFAGTAGMQGNPVTIPMLNVFNNHREDGNIFGFTIRLSIDTDFKSNHRTSYLLST
jgi:hypothetical protein